MLTRNMKKSSFTGTIHFEPLERRELMSASPVQVPAVKPALAAHQLVLAAKRVATAVQTGVGLSAEYFSDAAMTTGTLVRTDPSINFSARSPLAAAMKSDAAAKWTGSIQPSVSDSYYFSIQASGPVTLTVDGVVLISKTTAPAGMVRSATPVTMTAGAKYSVEMAYTKTPGVAASVKLLWAGKHVKQQVVPQTALFPSTTVSLGAVTGGVIGQYFLGNDFQTPVLTRVDPTIDFKFGTSSPNAVIPGHTAYSIRWTGQISAPATGTFKFSVNTSDGVRVYVGDSLLIDNWVKNTAESNTGSIGLTAGQLYDLKVEYFHSGRGVGTVQLQWAPPGQSLQDIKPAVLTSTPPATAGVLSAMPASANEIDLSWTGSPTAAGYYVEQSTDGGTSFQTIATAPAGTTTYADTGLAPITSYQFRVVPTGSADTSTPSNTAGAMTLTTIPSSLVANTINSSAVQLTWSNVTGAGGYDILISPQDSVAPASVMTAVPEVQSPFTRVGTVPAGTNTYNVTGLQPGTNYLFEVEGIDADGVPSLPTTPAPAVTTPGTTSVTQQVLSPGSVKVAWSAVQGATAYVVQSSPTGNGPWTTVQTVASDVLSLIDSSITPGSVNHFRVLATNAGGSSVPSDPVTSVALTDAPAGLTATPFSSSQINLSWSDVANENGFVVLLDQPGTTAVPIATVNQGVLTDSVSGLIAGQSYQFEVESLNTAGAASAASRPASTTTPTIAPAVLTAVGTTPTSAALVWTDVPGETGFTIESSPTASGTWTTLTTVPAGTLTYADNTLGAGEIRYYRVSADDAGGTSAPSPVASALMEPATPAALLAGLSTAQSLVSWAAVPGATSYDVQRSTTATGTYTDVGTVAGSATSMTVANLLPSTVYYYRVTATNATGTSAPSTPVGQMSAPLAQYQQDNQIFGLTSTGGVFNVDETSGVNTLIGQLLPGAYDIRRDPLTNYLYYYVPTNGTNVVYTWDPSTGNNKLFSLVVQNPGVCAFRADGTPFVINTNGQMYSVTRPANIQNLIGTVRTLAGVTVIPQVGNISFDDAGNMYLLNNGTLYSINETTAVATTIFQVTYGDVFGAFGDNNEFYFTTPTGSTYQLNLNSLVSTLVGTGGQAFTDVAADPLFDNLSVTAVGGNTTLTAGTNANYSLTITNSGPDTESGPTTITATLPMGFTFVSAAGTNWTSVVSGSNVTLTYTGSILNGGTTPAVTLTVAIGTTAAGAKTTTFAAAGQLFNVDELFGTTTATNVVD